MNIFFDSQLDDAKRRQELYRGSLLVYSPSPSAVKLCEFARGLVEEAFHPHDPRTIHENMPVERCVEILASLKPKFIHHPTSKELIQGMLAERGWTRRKRTLMYRVCAPPFPLIICHPASPTHFIPIVTPGTPRPIPRSTGGCRFTKYFRKIAWLSTRATGMNLCGTARTRTTTTPGIATPGRMRHSTLNRIRGNNHGRSSRLSLIRRCGCSPG